MVVCRRVGSRAHRDLERPCRRARPGPVGRPARRGAAPGAARDAGRRRPVRRADRDRHAGDHLDVTTAHDPRPWRVSWTGPGSAEVGDARLQADGVSRGPGWVTVLFDPSDRVEVVVASAPGAGDAPAGEVVPDGRAPRRVVLGQGWSRRQPRRLLARRRRVRGREPLGRPAVVHPQRVRRTTSRRAGSSSSPAAPGARATCARGRSACSRRSAGRTPCATCCCASSAPRTPAATGRRRSSSSRPCPRRASRTRTATSSSGRSSPPATTCARPATRACSTRRSPSSATTPSASRRTVAEHLRRAVDRIAESTVPGSPLPAYGHGDWNDSLQPADPHLAAHLVSTWTAVLQTQSLRTLAEGLHAVGAPGDAADPRRRRGRARRAHPRRAARPARRRPGAARLPAAPRRRALRAARAPERRAHRAALRRAAVDPRDRRRPADARAGAAPPRPHRGAPARPRRRAPLRPAGQLRRRPDDGLPARRGEHLLGPRDRPHVHARAPALRRGAGPRR